MDGTTFRRAKTASEDCRSGVPVLGQLGIRGCLFRRDRPLAPDRDMNPAATPRATPGESRVIPPGTDQGIVNGPPVVFEPEINCLHRLIARCAGRGRLGIHDLRGHLSLPAARSIKGVHLVSLLCCQRDRRFGCPRHGPPPGSRRDERVSPFSTQYYHNRAWRPGLVRGCRSVCRPGTLDRRVAVAVGESFQKRHDRRFVVGAQPQVANLAVGGDFATCVGW